MALTRRSALVVGAGAAAAASIPAIQYVSWTGKEFDRPDYTPDLPTPPEGERAWANWSGIHVSTPKVIAVPKTEGELGTLLRTAKGPVRPVGSGHSFTALVPSEGTIVDVSRLSGVLDVDPVNMTATLGAGTRLRQAARLLSAQGLAFSNLPDIDVQTLAGSFSTATHGTGKTLPPIHDGVVGFRLITAAGETLDVTRDNNPALFAAGKVSLGALGVITQYTVQLAPLYNLKRIQVVEPTEQVFEKIFDLADQHRHFEILPLPNTGHTAVLTHDIFEGEVEGREQSQDDDVLGDLKDLRDQLGWWPWARRRAFGSYLASLAPETRAEESTDEYWKLLATSRPTKFNEMEYHLPLDKGGVALREVHNLLDRRKDAYFPMEFRFTAQDDAWLSPFNDGVRCSIAVHAPASERYDFFFEEIEPVFRKHGGRPHWGKLHSLGKEDLLALYPKFSEFLALRKELDPSGKLLNAHLATLFGETADA